jgi:hypothetical protein
MREICMSGLRRAEAAEMPAPPLLYFENRSCTIRTRFAALHTHLEQKATKATKGEMAPLISVYTRF